MKRAWEQLKPNERRVVVIIGVALFVVLNAWFVWPHFTDFHRDVARIQAADAKLATYRAMIEHKREYQNKIRALQEGSGSSVLPEDQAIDLMRFYDSRAIDNQVLVQNNSGVRTKTDEFFSEQELTLNVVAREKGLVGFLYSLGSGGSMVRVRNMSLRPDQSHQQLSASITIAASYQKAAKPSAPGSAQVASAKPAPTPANPRPAAPGPPSAAHTNKNEPHFLKSAATNKPGH